MLTKSLILKVRTVYNVIMWSWVLIPKFSFLYSDIICVISLLTFHPKKLNKGKIGSIFYHWY